MKKTVTLSLMMLLSMSAFANPHVTINEEKTLGFFGGDFVATWEDGDQIKFSKPSDLCDYDLTDREAGTIAQEIRVILTGETGTQADLWRMAESNFKDRGFQAVCDIIGL